MPRPHVLIKVIQFDMTDAERKARVAAGRQAIRDLIAGQTVLHRRRTEPNADASNAAGAVANEAASYGRLRFAPNPDTMYAENGSLGRTRTRGGQAP